YYNDELLEEEIDFMCGMHYMHQDQGTVSWWSRPHAWNASGLNVGFWSARCED
ncbi:hypothetical protein P692DRAFT_201718764, partial [Suillus brevipes Sb2]